MAEDEGPVEKKRFNLDDLLSAEEMRARRADWVAEKASEIGEEIHNLLSAAASIKVEMPWTVPIRCLTVAGVDWMSSLPLTDGLPENVSGIALNDTFKEEFICVYEKLREKGYTLVMTLTEYGQDRPNRELKLVITWPAPKPE